MRLFWLMPAAMLLACQHQPDPPGGTQASYRIVLDKIADTCGVPRSSWTLIGKDAVSLSFPPGEPYEKADCLIREFHKFKLPLKLGFIGNEAYETNEP